MLLQIFLSTRWAILLNLHVEMFRVNKYPVCMHLYFYLFHTFPFTPLEKGFCICTLCATYFFIKVKNNLDFVIDGTYINGDTFLYPT